METKGVLRKDPKRKYKDVERLQEILKFLGFDPGPVDGIFGDKTERAVREFQTKKKLKVDGIVGPKTAMAISKTLKELLPEIVAAADITGQKALLDLIGNMHKMLRKLKDKLCEKQKKEFEELEKTIAKALLKMLEKDLDELEKMKGKKREKEEMKEEPKPPPSSDEIPTYDTQFPPAGVKFVPNKENPDKIVVPAGGPSLRPYVRIGDRVIPVVYE